MAFNAAEIIKNIQEEKRKLDENSGSKTDYKFKVAWLPEGSGHLIKLIPDPKNEFVHVSYFHKLNGDGDRIPCGRQSNDDPIDKCPICQALKEAQDQGVAFDWTWNRKALAKSLIYLVTPATGTESDYWKKDSFYIMLGNSYMKKGVISGISMVAQQAENMPTPEQKEEVIKMLNPREVNQPSFSVDVKGGQSGHVILAPNQWARVEKALDYKDEEVPLLETAYADFTKYDEEKGNQMVSAIKTRVAQVLSAPTMVPPAPTAMPAQPTQVQQAAAQGYQTVNEGYSQPVAPSVPTPPAPGAVPPPPAAPMMAPTAPNVPPFDPGVTTGVQAGLPGSVPPPPPAPGSVPPPPGY